jgi:hypothetical protein
MILGIRKLEPWVSLFWKFLLFSLQDLLFGIRILGLYILVHTFKLKHIALVLPSHIVLRCMKHFIAQTSQVFFSFLLYQNTVLIILPIYMEGIQCPAEFSFTLRQQPGILFASFLRLLPFSSTNSIIWILLDYGSVILWSSDLAT